MQPKNFFRALICLAFLAALLHPAANTQAFRGTSGSLAQDSGVTAFDLIIAMNTLRTSNGLPSLVEDPIIDAVAQSTAEIMAANQMSWHIGNVSGRLSSAGYGGGSKVWGTENFAVGGNHTIDTIMLVWSDESHMIPAVNPAYCNVGAGIAKSGNGMTYYVLQAAYTSGKSCGEYKSPSGTINQPGGTTNEGRVPGVSQLIVAVKVAEPDADGNIYHIVKAGQSFWSIAVAYKITIKDLEIWNNLSKESKLQLGQKLLIPGPNTKGYATPTPVGMFLTSTPAADGKVVHTVASYQTLSTIAQAYKSDVDTLLRLNNIQVDWPLQIGQNLVIHPSNITPSPTPRPLTPIEKLTPAADGKYYHVIKSGESLSWVAGLYQINVFDLMRWNALNDASILHPDQQLVLEVTPPATITPTPGLPTTTPTATRSPTATPILQASSPTAAPSPTAAVVPPPDSGRLTIAAIFAGVLLVGGVSLLVMLARRKIR